MKNPIDYAATRARQRRSTGAGDAARGRGRAVLTPATLARRVAT